MPPLNTAAVRTVSRGIVSVLLSPTAKFSCWASSNTFHVSLSVRSAMETPIFTASLVPVLRTLTETSLLLGTACAKATETPRPLGERRGRESVERSRPGCTKISDRRSRRRSTPIAHNPREKLLQKCPGYPWIVGSRTAFSWRQPITHHWTEQVVSWAGRPIPGVFLWKLGLLRRASQYSRGTFSRRRSGWFVFRPLRLNC
jgi:hypothetical protein